MKNVDQLIIEQINNNVEEGTSIIDYIMDLLHLARASAYRRLNGTIPFSFEEVVTLSKTLGFSIDNLVNTNSSARILISETVNSGNNSVEQFYKKTLQYLLIHLRDANRTGRASLMALLNEFPMQFAYQPYLFKLEYFLYLYYHKAIPANTRFADFHIPEDLASLQRECVYYYNSIPEVNAVIDSNLMERTVFRIKHFHSISYLSGEDIKLLQNDLINLLDLYEEILQTGKNKMGCNWNIWYSSLSVTSTNMLLEYNQNSLLSLWVFVTEPVFLQNNCNLNHLFSHHYSTLLRFSALLTHSNEIICHNVSRTMREQIDQLTEF